MSSGNLGKLNPFGAYLKFTGSIFANATLEALMRTNLPVTTVEYPITDETLIVSHTDTKGKLTYVNDHFVAK